MKVSKWKKDFCLRLLRCSNGIDLGFKTPFGTGNASGRATAGINKKKKKTKILYFQAEWIVEGKSSRNPKLRERKYYPGEKVFFFFVLHVSSNCFIDGKSKNILPNSLRWFRTKLGNKFIFSGSVWMGKKNFFFPSYLPFRIPPFPPPPRISLLSCLAKNKNNFD